MPLLIPDKIIPKITELPIRFFKYFNLVLFFVILAVIIPENLIRGFFYNPEQAAPGFFRADIKV